MTRKRVTGKQSPVKTSFKASAPKKTTKEQALGTVDYSRPMARESLFTPTKEGGMMRISGGDAAPRKALPKQQRLTLHDLRMAAVSIPMAIGSAYVGYKSGHKIYRALKRRGLKHNVKDLKEDAKKNLMHSLDLHENVMQDKKSPILFRKKRYPRGGGYYRPKSDPEE